MAHQWKCPDCGRTVPKKLDKCFGCGAPRIDSEEWGRVQIRVQDKTRKMSCASCGAVIMVPPNIERLTCTKCGTELAVERGEGFAALKVAEEGRDVVQEGTDETQAAIRESAEATQAELRRRQLRQDVASARVQLSSLQSEIRTLERGKKSRKTKKQLKELRKEEDALNNRIAALEQAVGPETPHTERAATKQPKARRGCAKGCLQYSLVGFAVLFGLSCLLSAIAPLLPHQPAVTQTAIPPAATPSQAPSEEPATRGPTTTHSPIPSATAPYLTYAVQSGDTLSSIAVRFGTTAEAIMELNGLTSTIICSGTQLLIPSTDVPVSPPTAIATSSDTPTPRPPTPTRQPTPTPVQEWRGVYIGMPADDVLKVWGQGLRTNVLGQDTQGLVVEWVYQHATLTMKRWQEGGITCYRVAKIRLH